jgi:acetolactate decarboxylase
VLLIVCPAFAGCSAAQDSGKLLFISGTYGALNRGNYDGDATVADLKRHGDFALGNFSGIDGEMLGLNGTYYQIGAQGKLSEAKDTWTVPNATVTFFKPDKTIALSKAGSYQEMQANISSQLPTPNIFYAMKVTGKFEWIKARTLTKMNKPYPSTPYSTITQNEPTFEFRNVDSTLLIVVAPSYTGEIAYPGYHAHFINSDGKYGGHVIDCSIISGQAEVANLPNFTVNLPQSAVFYQADFSKTK